MKIIGNNLLLLREALGLMQLEVSDKAGIARDYVSKIESGDRPSVSQTVIGSLALGLHSTEEWFTKSTGWSYNPPAATDALFFIAQQIKYFKPNRIIAVEYRDEQHGKMIGFVFISARGTLAMAGWQSLVDYGPESVIHIEMMRLFNETGIKVGCAVLSDTESKYLPHIEWADFIQRAKIGKCKTKDAVAPPLSTDERALIDKIRKTKMDVKALLEHIDMITTGRNLGNHR